jgi:YidC/Oxa1 family membrane protein insertase
MFHTLWLTILFNPLHNALAFILAVVPGSDVGIAIVLLTIAVKLILAPLSKKSIISQLKLKDLEPKLAKIKEIYTNKTEQAQKTFELYKLEGVNPFSGCLLIGLQLPIIIALFSVFRHGVSFAPDTLYSFIPYPTHINNTFLGIFVLSTKSIILALLVGATQYFQVSLTIPKNQPTPTKDQGFQADMARSMQMQMKYMLPIMMAFFSYIGTGIIALYFLTSNVFTIIQELWVRRSIAK